MVFNIMSDSEGIITAATWVGNPFMSGDQQHNVSLTVINECQFFYDSS